MLWCADGTGDRRNRFDQLDQSLSVVPVDWDHIDDERVPWLSVTR